MRKSIQISLVAAVLCLTTVTLPSFADDMSAKQQETYKEIEGAFGKVPEFVKKFPKAGIVGAWEEVKSLEMSDKTALSRKVKSLISLAVAAQNSLRVLHLCRYHVSQTGRRNRRGNCRGSGDGRPLPPLEHNFLWSPDRPSPVQEGLWWLVKREILPYNLAVGSF